ncbi:MAG: DUF1571 domain-containing protein [Planctomycetes bacterium]|nr:DUF1571 domain-containing protein [Planctomycetota bacterium]
MPSTRRGVLYFSAAIVSILPVLILLRAGPAPSITVDAPVMLAAVPGAIAEPLRAATDPTGLDEAARALVELAQRDGMALALLGSERYAQDIRDYRCVFLKQERLGGKLSPVQEIEVRYREAPLSVFMVWKRNASEVKRALFVDSARYRDEDGLRLARIEPAGAVIRLFVKDIFMPIHGPDAHKVSRRTIDEFGFKAILDLLEHYNDLAAANGVLDFRYTGVGEVDGRPTFVFTRNLPYEGPGGEYPDAHMILHLDQTWLLPLAVHSYADHEGKELLGSYVFTKVELNPGLGDEAFQF